MDWNAIYPGPEAPTQAELSAYVRQPLWDALTGYLAHAYGLSPAIGYSRCAAGRGWNVKYKAGGAALCTLYPGNGEFVCLIVVGAALTPAAERLLPTLTPYTQSLWTETPAMSNGVHWLSLEVTSPEILEDVKALLRLKRKPNPDASR